MPPHPLTNFVIKKYYQNEPKFNGVYSSFGVENIPQEIKAFIGNKNIKTNIFRIQAYDSIMCGYFYVAFIDFMLVRKTLTDFTNFFPPNNFKKNDDIILNYFVTNV